MIIAPNEGGPAAIQNQRVGCALDEIENFAPFIASRETLRQVITGKL